MSNDISSEANQTYRISELAQLSLVDSIRRRPGMYVGGVDERGLLHTCQGYLEEIYRECWNKPSVHYVVAVAHDHWQFACEEFEKPILGLPELFVSPTDPKTFHAAIPSVALNALSSVFRVAYRNYEVQWCAEYIRGEKSHSSPRVPDSFSQGIWWESFPDSNIFGETKINVRMMRDWLQSIARMIPNLSVDFHDLEAGSRECIHCQEGMAAQVVPMLDYHGLDRMAYPETIHLSDWTGDFRIDLAFTHHSFLNDHSVAAYCNSLHNAAGGAHVEGLVTGMVDALNQFADHDRTAVHVSTESIQRGLLAGISIYVNQDADIQGEGPTREPNSLLDSKIEATGQTITQSVHDFVHHQLFEYLRYEPGLGRAILAHVAA